MATKRAALKNVSLWPHQKKGVALVKRFIAEQPDGAALINMPTGTGKTGVIAVASQLLRTVENILIIAPRLMLRDQLAREVGGRFFAKVGIDPSTLSKEVSVLTKTTDLEGSSKAQKTVWVSTFQLIDTIRRTRPELLNELSNNLDLVIVDEGHYEPAPSWRILIFPREFGHGVKLLSQIASVSDAR